MADKDQEVARAVDIDIDGARDQWQLANECPLALVYHQRNYAVMLASPRDLTDFAYGFSISERVVSDASEIKSVRAETNVLGIDLHMEIDEKRLERLDLTQRRRHLVGASGCGLCGLDNADQFLARLPRVAAVRPTTDAMDKAMAAFSAHQQLNQQTHSVHGAAWVSLAGDIIAVREDVGRHNAVDKLLGARARAALAGEAFPDGFLMVSSRCSFEIVEKGARHNVGALLSISAPTALALDKAEEAGLQLYARAPQGIARF
ncbi:protein FdhD like protein [Maritalea myrionectae]|uniref:Protein FdhD like protein n=1 Tax=Maritalea myrionectae TaxID=454601 RepID=A0A2R4MDF4_9HYPH|nr:formate dehydrogenase accessory sulfurtransferase FdhD [Maritalea myrionectae]AVX03926.1 protein FdhD like protein [Maritalea myrionectae]